MNNNYPINPGLLIGGLLMIVGGLLSLFALVAPVDANATHSKALSTFCTAVKAVGPVPVYAIPLKPVKKAEAYSKAYLGTVSTYQQLVDNAGQASAHVTTQYNKGVFADWASAGQGANILETDAIDVSADLNFPKTDASVIPGKIRELKKQVTKTKHEVSIARAASIARGCKSNK
jgi:hypothetical protein